MLVSATTYFKWKILIQKKRNTLSNLGVPYLLAVNSCIASLIKFIPRSNSSLPGLLKLIRIYSSVCFPGEHLLPGKKATPRLIEALSNASLLSPFGN